MADPLSQTDPTFRTTQLYRKLTGKEARQRLIADYGYSEAEAPSARSLRRKLSALGDKPMKVLKSKPLGRLRRRMPSSKPCIALTHRRRLTTARSPSAI